jgi:hypothetical protein
MTSSRAAVWLIAPLLIGACNDRRTNIERSLQTEPAPVPVGQEESANVRARETRAGGSNGGAASLGAGGFGATSNQLTSGHEPAGSGGR